MTILSNDDLGVSFAVADRFTVREQLAFRSRIANATGEPAIIRYWLALPSVATDWQCKLVPDPATLDLDTAEDAKVADIVQWSANALAGHMAGLETPPKK